MNSKNGAANMKTFDDWWHYSKDGEDRPRHAWNACAAEYSERVKFLADKASENYEIAVNEIEKREELEQRLKEAEEVIAQIFRADETKDLLAFDKMRTSAREYQKKYEVKA